MIEKDEHHCVVCGEYHEQNALYCSSCGNYLHTNHFDFLGVSRDADVKAIRDAYLKQAIQCRPEKTACLAPEQKEAAAQKLQKLNEIWDVLSDEEKRLAYLTSLKQKEGLAKPARSLETLLWRRVCARYIDYILFAVLISALLQKLEPGLLEWFVQSFSQGAYFRLTLLWIVFAMAVVGAWAPLEAIFLSTLGTTPGKWLFQMQVVGPSQTKLPIKAALSRAMQAWSLGMGMGLIVLTPLANGYWYSRFKNGQRAYWDAQQQSEIIEQPLSVFRVAASSMITLQSLALGFLLLGPMPIDRIDNAHAYKATIITDQKQTQAIQETPVNLLKDIAKPSISTPPATPSSNSNAGPQPAETPALAAPSEDSQSGEFVELQGEEKNLAKSTQPANQEVDLPSQPVATSEQNQRQNTGIILPPSMQRALDAAQQAQALAETAEESPMQTAAARINELSHETRLACFQEYYTTMYEADDLPLAEYARINRRAAELRDRCLIGG